MMSHSSWAPRPRLLYSLWPTVKARVPACGSGETRGGAAAQGAQGATSKGLALVTEKRSGGREKPYAVVII